MNPTGENKEGNGNGGPGGGAGGGGGGNAGNGGNAGVKPPYQYALKGPQVEPTASLWLNARNPLCIPTNKQVSDIAEATEGDDRVRLDFDLDFPGKAGSVEPDPARLDAQLKLLIDLQERRRREPYPADQDIGVQVFGELGNRKFRPTPLSRFLQLQPVPFGTVFDIVERRQRRIVNVLEQHGRILDGTRIVNEGRELARVFEIETPGLFHRHALNWAFFNRPEISPPRQARVWLALDMAIYTALGAAWYYKWLRKNYSRLLRPEEYDKQTNGEPGKLEVLYDRTPGEMGDERGMARMCPQPTPGTPRHPAWPSGHSTYSAAASHILEFFFSPETLGYPGPPEVKPGDKPEEKPGDKPGENSEKKPGQPLSDEALFKLFPAGSLQITEPGWFAAELRRLANNVGEARLWGGVHWLSDHLAGQKIGRAAAEAVIQQFRDDCVPAVDLESCEKLMGQMPPSDAQIRADAAKPCEGGEDTIPPLEGMGEGYLMRKGTT